MKNDPRKRTDLELCIEDIQDFSISELNELSEEIRKVRNRMNPRASTKKYEYEPIRLPDAGLVEGFRKKHILPAVKKLVDKVKF